MVCGRLTALGAFADNQPFVSYQELVTGFTPVRTFTPTGIDELVAIVKNAEALDLRVRAAGSAWSQTPIMVTGDFLVQTDQLKRTLSETMSGHDYGTRDPMPPANFSAAIDPVFASLTGPAKSRNLYHVEAGIKIIDLYTRLECEPRTRTVVLTEPDGDRPLEWHGYALPTMGGAGGQSLAGAISTSTHGGDFDRPPTPDMVHGIHIVAAGGAEFFIQRGGPRAIVDVAMLQQLMPCVAGCGQVITDDDAFDAVVVSMGRMGIIYSMVLEVVPQYFLQQTIKTTTWNTVKNALEPRGGFVRRAPDIIPSLLDVDPTATFLELNLLPYPDSNGDHSCSVFSHIPVPPPVNRLGDFGAPVDRPDQAVPGCVPPQFSPQLPASQGGLFADFCEQPAPRAALQIVLDVLQSFAKPAETLLGLAGDILQFSPLLEVIAPGLTGTLLTGVSSGETVVTTAGSVVVPAAYTVLLPLLAGDVSQSAYFTAIFSLVDYIGFQGWLEQLVNTILGSQFQNPVINPDVSFRILDVHDYRGDVPPPGAPQQYCYRGESIEVGFDANESAYVEYIDYVLDRISGHYEKMGLVFAGWISVRYCGQSSALLAIEQFSTTVLVEISALLGLPGSERILQDFEDKANEMKATVHWGQKNSRSARDIEARFPKIDVWRATLATLSSHGSPFRFDNEFCQSHGLEPTVGAELTPVLCNPAHLPLPVAFFPVPAPRNPTLPAWQRFPPLIRQPLIHVPFPPGPPGGLDAGKVQALVSPGGCDCAEMQGAEGRQPLGITSACSLAYLTSPRATQLASGGCQPPPQQALLVTPSAGAVKTAQPNQAGMYIVK